MSGQDQQEGKKQMTDSYLVSVKLSDIQLKWLPIQEYEKNGLIYPVGSSLQRDHKQDESR